MGKFEFSRDEEVAQVAAKRPHVVLLGAGASRAAFPQGERHGRRLPLMVDFLEILPIRKRIEETGVSAGHRNFEDIYTDLAKDAKLSDVRDEIEKIVFSYFSSLELPSEATLYDHLILSLRPKDVIATFNWDPFLIEAALRNRHVSEPPNLLFLHGNVRQGYCLTDDVHGVIGRVCSRCHMPLASVKLLYPMGEKNYDNEPAIQAAWKRVRWAFENALMVTVFGYSAPRSDAAAVQLLLDAWGGWNKRKLEQFEYIDIRTDDELVQSWEGFVNPAQHHYEFHTDFFDSWAAMHPRRTGEAWWNQYLEALFLEGNPVPRSKNLEQVQEFYSRLVSFEGTAEG